MWNWQSHGQMILILLFLWSYLHITEDETKLHQGNMSFPNCHFLKQLVLQIENVLHKWSYKP